MIHSDFSTGSVLCPVLVGREAQVEAIRRAIATVSGGTGRNVLVAGEAGIGKTRLIASATRAASEQGFTVLAGACFAGDQASPYAVLIDLVRGRLTNLPAEIRAAAVGPYAREIAGLLPELVTASTDHALSPSPDLGQERRRLLNAFSHCIADPAGRPVLITVEDLHWCDEASLEGLVFLMHRATNQPTLIVGTYRSDEVDSRLRAWLAQLARERLVQEIALTPLSREEVEAMLHAIFTGNGEVPRELVTAVHDLAEGNPFYVEEILEALVASGDIRPADGAWQWNKRPMEEWRLPHSLHDAVQRRIVQLSPAAQEIVAQASVIGRRFDIRLLQQVARRDSSELLILLKELIAAQLVIEEARGRFAFRHALTWQVISTGLLATERAELHRMVGEAAEAVYGDLLEQRSGELAFHFAEAEVWEKVLHYARQAGERAARLYAPRSALQEFTRALDAAQRLRTESGPDSLAVSGEDLTQLRRSRGQAYETLGDFAQARADYEAALNLARQQDSHDLEWQSLLDLGFLWSSRDHDRAGAYFHQALELARKSSDPARLAQSLNRLGNWQANTDEPRRALPLHHEALSLFEQLGDRTGVAVTLDLLGMASYLYGDLPTSMDYFERAASLFRELNDRAGLAASLSMLATRAGAYELDTLTGDADENARALRSGEEALNLVQALDWPAGEAFVSFNLAVVLGLWGHYARALELGTRSLEIANDIEHRQWQLLAHSTLGQIYLDLLDLPAACHHLEQTLVLAQEVGYGLWQQLPAGCLASAYVQAGRLDQAVALLDSLPETVLPPESLGQRWLLFGRIQVALARRRPDLALELIGHLSGPDRHGVTFEEPPLIALARASALTALHRADEAETLLRAVRELAQRKDAQPLLWRTQLALGTLYRIHDRAEEARRAFAAARAVIDGLAGRLPEGTLRTRFLEQATAQLPRTYRLSPRRVTALRFGGLTTRERQVAALIAQGQSNREIAEHLVLGERTIESHVSNILGKLGVASRTEIATWAVRQGLA